MILLNDSSDHISSNMLIFECGINLVETIGYNRANLLSSWHYDD